MPFKKSPTPTPPLPPSDSSELPRLRGHRSVLIVSTDELGAGSTLCAWTRTFNARTPLDGLRVTPFCFSRRNGSLRTEAGLEPCPSPAPSPAPFSPPAPRVRNPCRTRAEASRAQGGLVPFVLLSFIQGPGNQVFRIGPLGPAGRAGSGHCQR